MPILTATDPPRKRRAPAALVILAVMILPLAGVFAWSCYQPVQLELGGHMVGFGYGSSAVLALVNHWQQHPSGSLRELPAFWSVQLPPFTRSRWYYVWWH